MDRWTDRWMDTERQMDGGMDEDRQKPVLEKTVLHRRYTTANIKMKRCLLTDHYRNDSLDHIHFHATVTDNFRKGVESGTPWRRRWDLKNALCKVLGCPTGSHTVGGCPGRSIFLIYAKNENICQQKLTDECSQQYSHSSQHVETAQMSPSVK